MPARVTAEKSLVEALSLEERIRRRAYELYLQRGNQAGSELENWLQAEEEIRGSQRGSSVDEASEEPFSASLLLEPLERF
jgi:Protein of unknown function (DUF2934)